MNIFLKQFRKHKTVYASMISLSTTVVLVNEAIQFLERVTKSIVILGISLIFFCLIIKTYLKEEQQEEQEK